MYDMLKIKDKTLSCFTYKTTKTITYKCTTSFLQLLLHTKQHYKIRLYCWKWIILTFFKTEANTSPSKSLDFLQTPAKSPGPSCSKAD